jgi:hypothetical protein
VHNQNTQVTSSASSKSILNSPYVLDPVAPEITRLQDSHDAIITSSGGNIAIITSPYLPEPAPQQTLHSDDGQNTDKSLDANTTSSSIISIGISTSPHLPGPVPQEILSSECSQNTTDISLGASTASSSSSIVIITSPYLPEPVPQDIAHRNLHSHTKSAFDAGAGISSSDAHALATFGHETKEPQGNQVSSDVEHTGEHLQESIPERNEVDLDGKQRSSTISASAHEQSNPCGDQVSTASSAGPDAESAEGRQRGAFTADIVTTSCVDQGQENRQNTGAEGSRMVQDEGASASSILDAQVHLVKENTQPVVQDDTSKACDSIRSTAGEAQAIAVEGRLDGTGTYTRDSEAVRAEPHGDMQRASGGYGEIPVEETSQADERVLELIRGLESRNVMNRITCAADLGRLCEESCGQWCKETCTRVLTATVQLLQDGTAYAAKLAEAVASRIAAQSDRSHLQSACACLCMPSQITRESAAELILTCCGAKQDENTAEYIVQEITDMLETLFGDGSNCTSTVQDSYTDESKAQIRRRVQDKDGDKHATGRRHEDKREDGAERHSHNVEPVSLRHDVLCSCTNILCRLCFVDGPKLGTADQCLRCVHALLRPLEEENIDEGAKVACLYAIGHLSLAYGRQISGSHEAASQWLPWGHHALKCVCTLLQHEHPQIRKAAVYCLPKLYVCDVQQPAAGANIHAQPAPASMHALNEAGERESNKRNECSDENIDSSRSSGSSNNKHRNAVVDESSSVNRNKGVESRSGSIGVHSISNISSSMSNKNAFNIPASAVGLVTDLLNDNDRTVRETAMQSVLELSSFDMDYAMQIIEKHIKTCESAQRRASVVQSLSIMFRLAQDHDVDWRVCGLPFIFREIEHRHASVRHAAQYVLSEMIKLGDVHGDYDQCHTDVGASQANTNEKDVNQPRDNEQDIDPEGVYDQEDTDEESVVAEPSLQQKARAFDDEAKVYVPLKTKRGEFLDELLWRSSEKDAMATRVSEAYMGVGALTSGITKFRGIERRGLGHTDPYVRENTVRSAQACAGGGYAATEQLQSAIVQQVDADSECERRAGVDAWRMGGRIKAWMGEGRTVYERLGDRGLEEVLLELGDGGCDEGEKCVCNVYTHTHTYYLTVCSHDA